jgi:hypothetical protein
MTTAPRKLLASTFLTLSCFAMAADLGSNITVTGWVIDSACAYTKGLDKPIGPACQGLRKKPLATRHPPG